MLLVDADNYFYPAWAYVWPTVVLRLPYSLVLSILWSAVVYYPVGLAPEASRYVLTVLLPVSALQFAVSILWSAVVYYPVGLPQKQAGIS